jgi:antitoxin component YwqK of YwqJK toxin-antitoxin module
MERTGEPTPDVSYYDNGAVRYRGFQLDGQMHGQWEFLRRDGSLMRAGEFDRGRQVGLWRTYDRTGAVKKETEFPRPTRSARRLDGGSLS